MPNVAKPASVSATAIGRRRIDNRLPGTRRRLGVLLSFSSDRCHGTNRLRITERGDAFPPACGLFGNGRYSPTQYSFEKVRTYIFPPAMAGVA